MKQEPIDIGFLRQILPVGTIINVGERRNRIQFIEILFRVPMGTKREDYNAWYWVETIKWKMTKEEHISGFEADNEDRARLVVVLHKGGNFKFINVKNIL